MSNSYFTRIAVAGASAAAMTAMIFLFVAWLNGVFFEDREIIAVTPCFFTDERGGRQQGVVPQDDAGLACAAAEPAGKSGIERFFDTFLRAGAVDKNEEAREALRREGFTR